MKSKFYILIAFFLFIFIVWAYSEPKVITYEPMQKNVKVDTPIIIKHDKAVNPNTVIESLSISPKSDFTWSYNTSNNSIMIQPKSNWQYKTTYNISINTGVRNKYGRSTKKKLDWSFTTQPIEEVTLTLLGDFVLYHLEEELEKGNSSYAFSKLNDSILKPDNFVFANLENPISNKGTEIKNKAYRFRSTPETIKILEAGNIDAVALANNHALDYGPEALKDTVQICNDAGIATVGYDENGGKNVEPVIIDHFGFKIGLVSYLDKIIVPYQHRKLWEGDNGEAGISFINDGIEKDIKYLKNNADIVIVALHWGIEREKSITKKQTELAHSLIDSGADVIMGHHPHVVQGIEKYNKGIIFYSLGNFVFPPTNEYRRSTYTAELKLSKHSINKTILHPIKPVNGIPHSMNEEEVKIFSNELSNLSSQFGTDFVVNKHSMQIK